MGNISSKREAVRLLTEASALGPRLQGAEGLGVAQRAADLLQEAGDLHVLLRLPAVEDDHQREVGLGPTQVVRALDLVVVEVHHLLLRVELGGAVAHHHDDVGPVGERALARRQRHHGGELLHAFGGLAVRVRVVVAVALEARRAAVVEHQRHVAGVVPADEGADLPVVVGRRAGCQGLHVGLRRLPAQGLVEVEAELGEQRRLEALQPHVQVRRLRGLLGLAPEQVLAGLFLPLEQLTPGAQLGVGAVQAEQRRQEAPLRHLSLAAQQLSHHVHLGLEALLRPAQDGMVEPGEEVAKGSKVTPSKTAVMNLDV